MLPWQTRRALKQRAETAEAGRDAAQRELEAQRQAHERELAEREPAEVERSVATGLGLEPLEPRYLQREPYRQPNDFAVEHRVGIRNPAGNPEMTGVRLEWTEMFPRPANQWGYSSVIPPEPVPRLLGGNPASAISLPPGREELWEIATTVTGADGTMSAGVFSRGSMGGQWRGMQWQFPPGDRWRFTFQITADKLPVSTFSIVMTAVNGQIMCELQ
jgi:hypothetical protein